MVDAALSPGAEARRSTSRLRFAALAAASIGGLEATSAFVVFPAIRDSIGDGDGAASSWVLTVSGIVGAAVLLQAGRLADRHGHRRLFRAGVGGFLVTSLLAAVAPTLLVLVGARTLQALSLSLMGPSSVALVLADTDPAHRSRTLGLWGAVTAVAGVVGAPLSAALVDLWSWRASFVAFAALAAVIAALTFGLGSEPHERADSPPIDLVAAVAIVVGLGVLVLALVEGNDWGWTSVRTLGGGAAALALIGVAVTRSRGAADPVIPLDLLGVWNVGVASWLALFTAVAFFAHWLVVLTLLTDLWGLGIRSAALWASVMPGTMAVLAVGAGRVIDRFGFRVVMVPGAVLYAVSFLPLALALESDRRWGLLIAGLVGAGIGMATVWPPLTSVGTRGVEPERLATATALVHTFQRVGGALGSALAVAWIAAGEPGVAATHRNPVWLLVAGGAVSAAGAMLLRDGSTNR